MNIKEIKIVKQFAPKFDVDSNQLEQFIIKYQLHDESVEAVCSADIHKLDSNDIVYSFNGEPYNLTSAFCSDLVCFLTNLDESAVISSMNFQNNKSAKKSKKSIKQVIQNNAQTKKNFWHCYSCGIKIVDIRNVEKCRKDGHEIIKFDSQYDNAQEKSHVDYVLEIMGDYNFLTIEDTEELLVYENGVYTYRGEIVIKQQATKRVKDCTINFRKQIIETIQTKTYVDRKVFDSDVLKLNVKNGIINLKTMTLEQHSPKYPSRMQLNVDYNSTAKPTKFTKFINDVLSDHKDITIIYEIFASALLRHHLNFEKILMLEGEGSNGKSTLLRVMIEVIGESNISHISIQDLTSQRFSRSGLDGKMLNIYADISNKELDRLGVVKAFVSGDQVSVEKKNKPQYTMKNFAQMVYSCNRLPEIDEDSDAIFRRFCIIQFKKQFIGKQVNNKLYNDLTTEEEKSGILNILLATIMKLLKTRRLSYEIGIKQIKKEWKEKSDSINNFTNTCLIVQKGHAELKNYVFVEYARFCKDRNIIAKSMKAFTELMRIEGYQDDVQRVNNKIHRVWLDIRLRKQDNHKIGLGKNVKPTNTTSDIIQSKINSDTNQTISSDNTLDNVTTDINSQHTLNANNDISNKLVENQSINNSIKPESTQTKIKYFMCKNCDAGPWGYNDRGTANALIRDTHKGHVLLYTDSKGNSVKK